MKAHKITFSAGRRHSYRAWLLILLSVPVILIYAGTLTGPFIFDDKNNIEENPIIKEEENTIANNG